MNKFREGDDPQPPLAESGMSEAEVWWHVCEDSGLSEYRTNGWGCAQCGARGSPGDIMQLHPFKTPDGEVAYREVIYPDVIWAIRDVLREELEKAIARAASPKARS